MFDSLTSNSGGSRILKGRAKHVRRGRACHRKHDNNTATLSFALLLLACVEDAMYCI